MGHDLFIGEIGHVDGTLRAVACTGPTGLAKRTHNCVLACAILHNRTAWAPLGAHTTPCTLVLHYSGCQCLDWITSALQNGGRTACRQRLLV